jgi:prolyl 4-hydroxylase
MACTSIANVSRVALGGRVWQKMRMFEQTPSAGSGLPPEPVIARLAVPGVQRVPNATFCRQIFAQR